MCRQMLVLVTTLLTFVGSYALEFRPPAIPLLTTDPFMQTWMRGDTSTSAQVTHWDGAEKQMVGYIAVDGQTFQYLGRCTPEKVTKPGPATKTAGHDMSPGKCDISNSKVGAAGDCNELCYGSPTCQAYVMSGNTCYLKSCTSPVIARADHDSYVITGPHNGCTVDTSLVKQKAVHALPTRTIFEFDVAAGAISFNLTFLSTMFTDDFMRLSRPVYYIDADVVANDGKAHDVQLYFDISAQHTVNSCASQSVAWKSWVSAGMQGIQLGNADQNVVGSKGDRVNIDWGYLHLAAGKSNAGSRLWAGSANTSRAAFLATRSLPASPDARQPRKCSDDLPALAIVSKLGSVARSTVHHTIMLAYDDVKSVNYFGDKYAGLWTQTYSNIQHAISVAASEHDAMLAKSQAHDEKLFSGLLQYGEKYATLCALSYRQTLAATKLVWNSNRSVAWNFLKEISTNGDMQTMDVIYPGSPMLLYTEPELLRLLLVPVLAYANNETYVRFGDPYSPHQLGTYPIADSPTSAQEPMPLENTGNMFFMMLGVVQQQSKGSTVNTSWFYPKYWPMLATWADELVRTTQFPANQLCTDDFTGRLANNTNLGAKGIVALEVFAELCRLLPAGHGTDCEHYSRTASAYAKTWQNYSFAAEPEPHYKMSYNKVPGVTDSWSIKYNLLWQKMLNLKGPFPWDTVVPKELAYYQTKANKFGIPMDPRHTYVKTDWLSWIAAMAPTDADFRTIFDPIFDSVNSTADRNPFTDLYDTTSAHQSSHGFIARPVIGGLFAKALEGKDREQTASSLFV